MARVRFSKLAESDLLKIASYTPENWVPLRRPDTLNCSKQHVSGPLINNPSGDLARVRHSLWRINAGRHVIFYRIYDDGITVSRILHERMLPSRHAMDD